MSLVILNDTHTVAVPNAPVNTRGRMLQDSYVRYLIHRSDRRAGNRTEPSKFYRVSGVPRR